MSKNAIARLGCIVVVLLLLATVATSVPKTSKRYYNGLKQTTMNDYKMDNPEWYPKIEEENMK